MSVGLSLVAITYNTEVAAGNCSTNARRGYGFGFYKENKTFICWPGPGMDPYVRMYRHNDDTWGNSVKVWDHDNNNYHDWPTIVVDNNNYPHIFWSKHNGMLHHAKSNVQLGVEGGWTHQSWSDVATYPYPVVTANNNIYCFYREGTADYSDINYMKSTNGGSSFTRIQETIRGKEYGDGVYLMHVAYEPAHSGKPERIHLTWFYDTGSGSTEHKGVYIAYFHPSDGKCYSVEGDDLGASISTNDAEKCAIETASTDRRWNIVSSYLDNGDPIVVYRWITSDATKQEKSARWNGSSWTKKVISTDKSSSIYDIQKYGSDDFRVFFRDLDSDKVLIYKSTNGGDSWSSDGSIDLTQKINRLGVVENYNDEIQFVMTEDPDYSGNKDYTGSYDVIVAGDSPLSGTLSGTQSGYYNIKNKQYGTYLYGISSTGDLKLGTGTGNDAQWHLKDGNDDGWFALINREYTNNRAKAMGSTAVVELSSETGTDYILWKLQDDNSDTYYAIKAKMYGENRMDADSISSIVDLDPSGGDDRLWQIIPAD